MIVLATVAWAYLGLASSPQGVPSACSATWQPEFGTTGDLSGAVRALASLDLGGGPVLYAAGDFSLPGTSNPALVAKWDGERWIGLDAIAFNSARCLTAFDDGSGPALFVGGNPLFPTNAIGKWTGSAWEPLGTGLTHVPNPYGFVRVNAVVVHDDGSGPALYVGGVFDFAGGNAATNIARWDGATWTAVGGGTDGEVRSLVVADLGAGARLFAGGSFGSAGGVAASRIASWDGTTWSALGLGTSNTVRTIAAFDDGSGTALYVGGSFHQAGGTTAERIARWDGAAWSGVGSGLDNSANSLAAYDDGAGAALYVVGEFTTAGGASASRAARWDGSSWRALGSGLANGNVYAITVHTDASGAPLVVGGDITTAGGSAVGNVARSDGSSFWRAMGGNLVKGPRAFAMFDDGTGSALHAGGAFSTAGGMPLNKIAKWTGGGWTPLGSGLNGDVDAMCEFDAGSGGELYVAGGFTDAGGVAASYVARWNGIAWNSVGSGVNLPARALATFDDGTGTALYVGGEFGTAGGSTARRVARWDGAQWSAVGALANSNFSVLSLEVFDDGTGPALYAGGYLASINGAPAKGVAKWDGSNWSSVGGTVVDGGVFALRSFDDGTGDALYAGGSFFLNTSPAATSFARWNGSSWSAVPGVDFLKVDALAAFDAGAGAALYAAGVVTSPTTWSQSLVRWDGVAWSSAGDFAPAQLHALEVLDDGNGPAMYVGGGFDSSPAGDAHVAKLGCSQPSTTFCTPAAPGTSGGCVATIAANDNPDVAHASPCIITVSNVDGLRSGCLLYGITGQVNLPWCPNGTSSLCVAPPRQRMTIQDSGGSAGSCSGSFVVSWNAYQLTHPLALGQPWLSGATVDAQAWFRDPAACKTSALSQGLRLVYQ